jgi:hypothetical protein
MDKVEEVEKEEEIEQKDEIIKIATECEEGNVRAGVKAFFYYANRGNQRKEAIFKKLVSPEDITFFKSGCFILST